MQVNARYGNSLKSKELRTLCKIGVLERSLICEDFSSESRALRVSLSLSALIRFILPWCLVSARQRAEKRKTASKISKENRPILPDFERPFGIQKARR